MSKMDITKREVLFSVIIVFIMLFIGFFVHDKMEQKYIEDEEKYYKSLKIESNEQFDYSLKTNVGNSLLYGVCKANGSVTIPELTNEYSVVVRHIERYTKHIETKTVKDSEGNTKTVKEVTYSWDDKGDSKYEVDSYLFMGKSFKKEFFHFGEGYLIYLNNSKVSDRYQNSIRGNYIYKNGIYIHNEGDLRFYYTGYPTKFTGTMFATLKNNGINSNETEFYYNQNISDVLESKSEKINTFGKSFRFFWGLLIVGVVVLFYYLDNHWLEDKYKYN